MSGPTDRQLQILRLLAQSNTPVTNAEVARFLGISPRTVRSDVSHLNRVVGGNVVLAAPTGYNLGASGRELLSSASATPSLDDQTRAIRFLLDVTHTDLFAVAAAAYTGETKTRAVLSDLKPRLSARGIELRITGFGVTVDGSEFARRRLLGRIMQDELVAGKDPGLVMRTYLPGIDLGEIESAIRDVIQEAQPEIDRIQRQNLAINAAICLARRGRRFGAEAAAPRSPREIPHQETGVDDPPSPGSGSTREAARLLAATLVHRCGGEELSAEDIQYLEDVIRILEVRHNSHGIAGDPPSGFRTAIEEAIIQTLEYYGLETDRDRLVSELVDHVRRLHTRKSGLFFFHNVLQNSLRSRSPFLYDVAVHLARELETRLELELSPDDIGLFAVYLGLHSQEQRPLRAGELAAILVCPRHYPGLHNRLLGALTLRYSDRLRITAILESDADALESGVDLVLSTTAPEGSVFPVVRIGALLSPLDYTAIDEAITRATTARFRRQISSTLGRFFAPDLFFTNIGFDSADATIRFLVDALERTGAVGPHYLDSVLERERRAPTVFLERFAIPHSMEFLAETTRITILIPATAIPWGESKASIVVMPAVSERDYPEFSEIYQSLVELLYDPPLFSELTKIGSFGELSSFLQRELQAP